MLRGSGDADRGGIVDGSRRRLNDEYDEPFDFGSDDEHDERRYSDDEDGDSPNREMMLDARPSGFCPPLWSGRPEGEFGITCDLRSGELPAGGAITVIGGAQPTFEESEDGSMALVLSGAEHVRGAAPALATRLMHAPALA